MYLQIRRETCKPGNQDLNVGLTGIVLTEAEFPDFVAANVRTLLSYKDQGFVAELRIRTDTGVEVELKVIPEPLI